MKIAWFSEKSMDQSIDHASWTEMTRILQSRGHDVQLYTGFRQEKKDFGLGRSIHYLSSMKIPVLATCSFSFSMGLALIRTGFFQKVDVIIVHPHALLAYAGFMLLKRLFHLKSKLIVDVRTLPVEVRGIRGRIENLVFHLALKIAVRGSDGVTFITPFMREILTNRYDFSNLPTAWWSSGAKEAWLKEADTEYAISNGPVYPFASKAPLTLIYHGAMSANRGLYDLIYAFADSLHTEPDIRLILLGQGPIRNDLMILCDKLKCRHAVAFIDTVPHEQVRSYLNMADVGVVPLTDRLEWRVSSPLKLLEYMAMGLPVILSEIEAHVDVAKSAEFAFFYPPGDRKALTHKISQIMTQRDVLFQSGLCAKKQIQKDYTWHCQAKRLELFLQNL